MRMAETDLSLKGVAVVLPVHPKAMPTVRVSDDLDR